MQTAKPFQTKRAVIQCSCGNNGFIITEYHSVTLAKSSVNCAKQRLFNPVWIEQIKSGFLKLEITEQDKLLDEHLKQGHKLKVYVP